MKPVYPLPRPYVLYVRSGRNHMKTKLLIGLVGLLLASSSMFAGWRVGIGVGAPPVYVAPVHPYHHYWGPGPYVGAYAAPAPYPAPYVAPAPYVDAYAGPAPFYGAIWIPGRWAYGPHGRYWARGYWGHRR